MRFVCQIDVVCLKTADLVAVTSCAGLTTPRLDDVMSSSMAGVKETRTDSTANLTAERRAKPSRIKARFGHFLVRIRNL